jgi:hypothetical protein
MAKNLQFSILLCLLFMLSCAASEEISIFEAKMQSLKMIGLKNDSTAMGHLHYKDESANHWIVIYSKIKIKPEVFIFNADRKKGFSHRFSPKNRKPGIIEKVELKQLTEDDEPELLLYIHYDYGTSFQGRELIVCQYPFEEKYIMQVFAEYYERIYQRSLDFDTKYGMPINELRIERKARFSFYKEKIILKGIIDKKENHRQEYTWNKYKDRFKLTLDEVNVDDVEQEYEDIDFEEDEQNMN